MKENDYSKKLEGLNERVKETFSSIQKELNKLKEFQEIEELSKEEEAPFTEPDWVAIPAGKPEIEEKTHTVEAFEMAKYPVTNLEFNVFIRDPAGYNNPEWWKELPADDINDRVSAPQDKLDHPRVNVNWSEATAYCRWLSDKLGYTVELATEGQWQQAATGGNPDNVFPWGKDADSERCNVWESKVGGTTPVTQHPEGATEQGVFDMVGNVWEWCKDEYK